MPARLRRKSKDSSTYEVLRRRRRRDHRTTVTRHRLASIVLCPCSRPSHDGIAADLAARYLYRMSHSARNSRSSGDHGGSTSLKLILTQPKSDRLHFEQPRRRAAQTLHPFTALHAVPAQRFQTRCWRRRVWVGRPARCPPASSILAQGDLTAWLTMQSTANQSPHQIPC